MLYRVLSVMLAMGSLLAGFENWKNKAFPDWDQKTVRDLLTDSPWAKEQRVKIEWRKKQDIPFSYKDVPGADKGNPVPGSGGSPVGGIGGGAQKSHLPDRADLIVRWASALPVRQAKALYRVQNEKPAPKNLNEMIGVPEKDYVLEIFGVPALVAHQGTSTVEDVVRQSAWLQTKDGKKLRASKVEATLNGLQVILAVSFPRNGVQANDREVEFYTNLQVLEIREKFKLGAMVYQGHFEM